MHPPLLENTHYIICITPKVIAVIIPAAISTPRNMHGAASLSFMSSSAAMSAPVHAPVPGSGMPTNSSSAIGPYFLTFSPFRCAFFSIFVMNASILGMRWRIQWKMRFMYTMMNGTGTMLPSTAASNASG